MDAIRQLTRPVVLAREAVFRIGSVEVRPETCELVGPDRTLVIEPRVMQVLIALHAADGHVVSRDDLLERCWNGRIVGDDSIHRVISRLRQHAEQLGGQFRVETITRVGYRLVIPVVGPQPDPPSTPPQAVPVSRRGLIGGAAAVTLAALGGAVAWRWSAQRELTAAVRAKLLEGDLAARPGSAEAQATAAAAYRAATLLAPDRPEPWGALAATQANEVSWGYPREVATVERNARLNAGRALSIDPDEGRAHYALLCLEYGNRGPTAAFERRLLAALGRAEDWYLLEKMRAFLCGQVGRTRTMLQSYERLIGQHGAKVPVPHLAQQAYGLYAIGNLDGADQRFTSLIEQWPRNGTVWFSRQRMLAYSGRLEQSLAFIDDHPRRPAGVPESNYELLRQQVLGLIDPPRHRETAVRMTLQSASTGTGFAANAIVYLARLGLTDQAFALADALYFGAGAKGSALQFTKEQAEYDNKRRFTQFLFEPATASLRADPRFASLTERLGLARYWKESRTGPELTA